MSIVRVVFVQPNFQEVVVEGEVGETLMEAAVDNLVPGVLAECGGACVCATCHVIPEPEWSQILLAKSDAEAEMLEGALDTTEHSRLSCQIALDTSLDGIRVKIPAAQI